LEWGYAKVGAPYGGVVGELRPYERSRWAEHGKRNRVFASVVPAPPEVVMVSPPREGPAQRFKGVKRRPEPRRAPARKWRWAG
jgi:hypothetical protein